MITSNLAYASWRMATGGHGFIEKWIRIRHEYHSQIHCKTGNIGGNQVASGNVVQP
jgi:hypothetical protein